MAFALTPVGGPSVQGLPGNWLQVRKAGVDVGNANVEVIDIVANPLRYKATRGVGENAHVITINALVKTTCVTGPVWTVRAASSSKRWTAIAFGEGIMVGAGADTVAGRMCAMYSTDWGVTWQVSPTAFPDTFGYGVPSYGMAYGNGLFLGLLNPVQIARSLDGINWTFPTFAGSSTAIHFGGGVFVIALSTGCQTTPDAIVYTPRTVPLTAPAAGVYADGVHVLVGTSGSARSVDNGVTWTAGGALPVAFSCLTLAYGNGIIVGTSNLFATRVFYSLDKGLTWNFSDALSGASQIWGRVRYAGGIFYLSSVGGTANFKSVDGITWAAANSNVGIGSFSIDWDFDPDTLRYAALGNGGSPTSVTNSGVCG